MNKQALLLSLLSLCLIAGCGENIFEEQESKGTTEAQQFNISSNLDSGNYQAVLNDPDATATEYAEAAMGLAGLDPVGLIKAMNDAAAADSSNDLSTVTSLAINPDALDELQTAEDKLSEELTANPTDPDLNFQMTLTSVTSTITALAQVGQNNNISYTDSTGQTQTFDATDGISELEATALGNYIVSNPTVQVDTDGDGVADTSLVTVIAEDVANVVNTLPNANLGTGSDLNTVLTETTQGANSIDYDGNGTVSATDISNYLTQILGK